MRVARNERVERRGCGPHTSAKTGKGARRIAFDYGDHGGIRRGHSWSDASEEFACLGELAVGALAISARQSFVREAAFRCGGGGAGFGFAEACGFVEDGC